MIIKVNNKNYTFKFTIWTIEKTCELLGIGLNEYDDYLKANSIKGMNALFRAALDVGTQGEIILNQYEIDNLIEQIAKEDFYKIYKDYLNSLEQIAIKLAPFMKEEQPKKK